MTPLVAEYIEQRLLQPKRLEQLLSHVLDRRTERAERRKSHIAELRKRASEADAKLKRLYDAIENGIADLSDPLLKDRIAELKATRDQARRDAERAEDAIDRAGPTITPQTLKTFARTARKRMRTGGGGYRRDHLRALAQRVEVDKKELRIMGSKSALLRTLVAASTAKTVGFGVPSSVPKWRARRDSNSRPSESKSARHLNNIKLHSELSRSVRALNALSNFLRSECRERGRGCRSVPTRLIQKVKETIRQVKDPGVPFAAASPRPLATSHARWRGCQGLLRSNAPADRSDPRKIQC